MTNSKEEAQANVHLTYEVLGIMRDKYKLDPKAIRRALWGWLGASYWEEVSDRKVKLNQILDDVKENTKGIFYFIDSMMREEDIFKRVMNDAKTRQPGAKEINLNDKEIEALVRTFKKYM